MEQTPKESKENSKSAANPKATDTEAEQPLSKNALKKAAKEAEKARKKAEAAERNAVERASKQVEAADFSEGKYGILPLIQSTQRTG